MAGKRIAVADSFDDAVFQAAEVLRSGGVIVFPTETVYGIGVACGAPEALEKLRRLKSRDAAKPFQYLTADVAMAESAGAVFSGRCRNLASTFWPGPLTMVVPDATGGGTLGIRVPDSRFILAVCRRLGMPVIASSANEAGQEPPLTADAADVFDVDVDLLVDGGTITGGVPSTVIRCLDETCEVLRQGAISENEIQAVWIRQ